jgi:hypothetical protein
MRRTLISCSDGRRWEEITKELRIAEITELAEQ